MEVFDKLIQRASANFVAQRILEKVVSKCHRLMGIGSGGDVFNSGERAVIELMAKKYIQPYCVFDVGSNTGQFLSLLLRTLGKKRVNVHCFEPSSTAFEVLQRKAAGEASVKANNFGLASERKERVLFYDKPGSGLASLTRRRLDHFGIQFDHSEAVRMDTLDNYCFENKFERIHFLKVDVEGHEMEVLRGGEAIFSSNAIEMVLFEFGGCNIDIRTFMQDFFYFFRERHMNLYRITPSGYLYPLESYKEMQEQFITTNFLAMRGALH
jgi:FkbM family methyltransferase